MYNPNLSSVIKRLLILSFFFLLLFQSPEVKAQFANGADVSWLSQMEEDGYIFKNSSGIQESCLEILKEKGINALRFRVWVNPQDGYSGKKYVAHEAYIADSMGFKILLDFHLSDTWADPGHQTKPAAWANDSFQQLQQDVYNHVYDVLDTLKSIGVVPVWVQIGNEVDDGILWETGRASTHMSNFAALINSGYNAVKAVDSTTQVIIHLANANDDAMYRWMFDGLKKYGAKWDIIGMSVYPYWVNLSWEVDDSLALLTMKDMISRYNSKVMVCEAGYLYNQPVQAKDYLSDLITKTKSVGGLGVFYWEPECYNWQGYQLGAWDPVTKEPTVALDAFLLSDTTSSISDKKNVTSYKLNVYPNPFNPGTTIDYSIQYREHVVIGVYNILGERVKIIVDSIQQAGAHSINWNGKNESDEHVSSGVYLVRMQTGKNVIVHKIVMQK